MLRPRSVAAFLRGVSARSAALACLPLALLASCSSDADVVVYVAMDQVHSEAIIERFEEETGLTVKAVYDVEANKTVGLVNQIRQEADAPRCDVFWNNEIANTVALAKDGLLAPYDSSAAADIPAAYRDPNNAWTGFALRARCLILNTEKLSAIEPDPTLWPDSIADLEDERWAEHGAIAVPLTGTTLTHLAVLWDLWGEERTRAFAEGLVASNAAGGVDLPSGNGPLMRNVGDGAIPWGWTDTDDFNVGRVRGYPVERRFADQGEDEMGTLVIPNTVALVANGPNPDDAKKLIDFLLSHEVEQMLAEADSAQIPTRDAVSRPDHVPNLGDIRVMPVDWKRVGESLPQVQGELKTIFRR